jgi:hypothetical protein
MATPKNSAAGGDHWRLFLSYQPPLQGAIVGLVTHVVKKEEAAN